MSLPKIPTLTVVYWSPSSLAATRWLSLLPRGRTSIGRSTYPLATSTTMCVERITTALFCWVSCPFPKVSISFTTNILVTHLKRHQGTKKDMKDAEFHHCRHQIYYSAIACMLQPLHMVMTKLVVVKCPDCHYRCMVYSLGPYIGDYPKQALLSCIVQGWCAKYVTFLLYCIINRCWFANTLLIC